MKKIYWFMVLGGILLISIISGITYMQPTPLWSVKTSTVNTAAVLSDDTIIFGTTEGLYCVHAETGIVQWHFASTTVMTTPAIVGDVVARLNNANVL